MLEYQRYNKYCKQEIKYASLKYNIIGNINNLKQMFLQVLFIAIIQLRVKNFDFKQLTVYPDLYTIGVTTQYNIVYQRYINNANSQTAWSSVLVPSGSTITFTFPSQYTLSSPSCVSLTISSISISGFSCTTSGNTITITNAINTAQYVYNVQLVLANIMNPVPAIFATGFQGTIGSDAAIPYGDGVQLTSANFDNCGITFDNGYVNQTTATMVVTVDPKNALGVNSQIVVDLPARWTNDINTASTLPISTSMICVNYSSGVISSPTCSGQTISYTITVSNLLSATTSSSFSFGVKSLTSPPTLQPSDLITIRSYDNTYEVDKCDVRVSGLIPNPFILLVVSSSQSMTVNTDAGLKFQMTVSDWVNLFDDIQVTFPPQILPTFVNISGSGSYTTTSGSVNGQVLSVTHLKINKIFAKNTVYTLNFYKIKCPPSTKTSSAITVKINRNGFGKMSGTTTIKAIASTLTGSASALVTTVGKTTSYNINIVMTDGLSSSGMVKIVFPSTIKPTLSTGCATLIGTSVKSSPTCTYDSISNTILISSMNSSSSVIPAQTLKVTVLSVVNAPSIAPSSTFAVTTYYSTDTDAIVSQGTIAGVTASMDIIDASTVSVVPSTYVVADTLVTYTVNFKIGNTIPQGGYIQMTIPSGIDLNYGSISSLCKISTGGTFYSTSCTANPLSSGFYVNFSSAAQSLSINAGTSISLRIQQLLTNPYSTTVISSFTIKTYHSNSYAIQQLLTGISVQMNTPSPMTSMAVTRPNSLNSGVDVYTIKLKQVPDLLASSKLIISIPQQISISSITCTSLTGGALAFTTSSNTITVTLASAFATNTEFGVILGNCINPPSFAPLSSSFSFITKSSDLMLSYASGAHTSLLMTSIASTFASISGTYSTRIYGQATTLQISVKPSVRKIPSYMQVTIPSTFTVTGSLSCTSWSCTAVSSHLIRINSITSTSLISFTISGMTTPTSSTAQYVKVASYDSGSYKIDQSTNDIPFSIVCTMPCRTCTTTNSSACTSCYSNTAITTYIYIYDTTSMCYDICPSSTYTDNTLRKCLVCNTQCLTCLGTASNCTSCITGSSSAYPYLFINSSVGTCRSACPLYYYPDTTTTPIQCVLCVDPCLTCTSISACTSCVQGKYFYNNACQTTCPNGTTIPNDATNTCDLCSTQCQTCSILIDNCTSCSGSAAVDSTGKCVNVCPAPYVKYNGVCANCSTKCLTCSITYNNCTSCDSSTAYSYLYNYDCVVTCPQLYYPSLADAQCKLCSTLNIGCNNCTSTSTCGTCNWDQGYVFLTNKCYSVTPTGYYNSSGYAVSCDASKDCATCDKLPYNCTACITLNLQGNKCVPTCQAGFVGINKVCLACTNGCKTCQNLQSNCTSCVPGSIPQLFLSNYECVTTCPDYTYGSTSNNLCTPCANNCQKCSSSTTCITCLSGYFLSVDQCLLTCPYGYLGINRVCVRCSSPCDNCTLSLNKCTVCLSTYYLVSATSTCVQNCPTGLYKNDAQGACTGCDTPCNTCSTTSTTCTSCLGILLLDKNTNKCVSNCSDGYYPLNGECNNCNINCTTCTSISVCLKCKTNFYLYSGTCLDICPSTHPVTTTGSCTACSDANCIICDYLDQCTQCNFPFLLLLGYCLASCPTNYTSNSTHCIYTPQSNTNNNTNAVLSQTLTSANLFPVPFTIAATFIGVACIMSRFQHSYTFLSGALYSFWSILEMGSLATCIYFYYNSNNELISLTSTYIQIYIFAGAVLFMYLLNLLALITQNCYLLGDATFQRWKNRQASNKCFYMFCSIVGLIITHKFKNVMFCKLFGFQIFKAKLQSNQTFKIFNAFSFLSFIPSAAVLFYQGYMIQKNNNSDQQLMAYIDVIVLTLLCIILAILNSRKGDDFFEEKDEEGVIINKRITIGDSFMHDRIVPFMLQQQDYRGNMPKNLYETQRKFKSIDTVSESALSFHYQQVKQLHNISVQAAPVLQDYSKIDFYNDQQMSEMSIFKKADKSMNVTKRLNMNQISIQNDGNIFDHKQVSVQNNPQQMDISMQHQIDARDISLQNVPNMENNAVQMSRHQQDHSIQCGVLVNNASIQYSAKPVFQDISQDFLGSDDQQNNGEAHSKMYSQLPAEDAKGLKPELQLDVDQKLRRKQQQLERQIEDQRQRQKQDLIRKFHQQQQAKTNRAKQNPFEKQNKQQKINQLFNNQNSKLEGSSFLDSDANIMVKFKNQKKQEASKQTSKNVNSYQNQNELQKKQRIPSAKTQKQFIRMLQNKGEPNNDIYSSISFNVTRDLQQVNGRKIKNVVYEQQDRAMKSQDDERQIEDGQDRRKKEVYILENDTNQQLPSMFDKSRSTNFRSTVRDGRRPPLPNRTNSKNLLEDYSNMENSIGDNGYEQINYNPIKPKARPAVPQLNYKQQDLSFQQRTNLNRFNGQRKKNIISANPLRSKIQFQQNDNQSNHSNTDQKQNPLPLPKIQRLKSQQSNYSADKNYKMSSKKVLLQDRRLQFNDGQKINLNTDHDQFDPQGQLPKLRQSQSKLRNSRSQTKMHDKDRDSFDKPVHRQILGKERFVDRTQKFLQKEYKKAENTRKKIEMMEVMLERPNINNDEKGYLKETYSSNDKKKGSSFQKIYLNNPYEKKQ